MGNWHGELDMAHPLTAYLREGDLDTALVTDMPTEADPLELTAVTLPVLDRTEDPLTEEAIPLWLEGAVIYRLGLGELAVRSEEHTSELMSRGHLLCSLLRLITRRMS